MISRRIELAGTYLKFGRGLFKILAEELSSGTLMATFFASLRKRRLCFAREKSYGELLEDKAKKNKNRIFLNFEDQKISYREMNEKANLIAHGLLRRGAKPGEGVGIMMGNCPEFLYIFFATQKLGMYVVPINTGIKGDGLNYILSHSEVRFLFLDYHLLPELYKSRRGLGDQTLLIVNMPEGEGDFEPPKKSLRFSELWRDVTGAPNPEIPFSKDNICLIMYTSGTTGLPRGVITRYKNTGIRLLGVASRLLYNKNDILYTCLPLFHANALLVCTIQAMIADAQVALSRRFSASRFWDEVRRYKATTFNALGAMIPILMKQPERPEDKDNGVRLVLTSACPQAVWEDFERRFGVRIWETYGAIDGGGVVTINFGNAPVGSIGKPLAVKYRIVDEQMRDVPPGDKGELIFKVGKAREGKVEYFKDQASSNEKVVGGWLHTGDLVYQDKKGFLYFIGRKTESMRRRGENVSEYEVEREVEKYPSVLECAAFGVPSELGEEDIMVCVVPREGEDIVPAKLHDFLKERLARFALPRYIGVVNELPKTATHRVIKSELRSKGVTPTTWDAEAKSLRP